MSNFDNFKLIDFYLQINPIFAFIDVDVFIYYDCYKYFNIKNNKLIKYNIIK